MNLLRSRCLAVLPQLNVSVFSPKGGNERRPAGFLRLAAVLAVLCLGSAGAWASICTVTLSTDTQPNGASGELRYCLNNFSAGDTINFSVTGKITLTSALPTINKNVTITGPGANELTISGGGSYSVFSVSSGTVSISGLKIFGGNNSLSGAAISQAAGSLMVTGCEFANNTSTVAGGAIYAGGSLTVSSSTFASNTGLSGGAIDATDGLILKNSTFSVNTATGPNGGAVYAAGTTAITITNNTFYGNSTRGGQGNAIAVSGTTETIDNNLFVNNSGGATINDIANVASASDNVYYGNSGADCPNCATNSNAVGATANPLALPLGYYGGTATATARTFLPQPGSAALCAGSASLASSAGLTADERGFAMAPAYTPCAAGSVDAGAVQANYIQVQASGDAGAGASDCQGASCTLRDAILLANSNGYGDIDFASGVSITLSGSGLSPAGTTGVNIIGGFGSGAITVNGGGPTSNFSVFEIPGNVPVLLEGLTISKGSHDDGGAINNSGTLTVVNSTISGNAAVVQGGGIFNSGTGTLAIAESTIANNSVTNLAGTAYGGGILSYGALQVVNSIIAGNSVSGSTTDNGGGIFVSAGSASLANIIVSANTTANGADANIGGTFTDGGGNVVGGSANATNNLVGGAGPQITLSPLQLNGIGAMVQTMIPLPGSPAICAGMSANIVSGLTTDERGYPLQPTSGYCTSSEVDAGAVQTNYTSVNFAKQPAGATSSTPGSAAVNTNMTSPAIIQVLETDTLLGSNNTDGVNGVPLSLTLTTDNAHLVNGSATTTGTGANVGEATFTNLQVSAPEMNDTLSLAAVTVGSSQLGPLTSDVFNVIGPATVLLVSAPVSTTAGAPFSVTVTAEDAAGNAATGYAGTVHFTSSDPGTALVLPGNYTFVPATDEGVHIFTNGVALVTVGAGSQTVNATDTVTGSITGLATVTVNKATPTVTMTAAGAAINVNGSVTFTATVAPNAGSVSIPFKGTMSFASNGTTIAGCPTQSMNVNTGVATCTTTTLLAGNDAITATYSGDSNYNASPASASTTQTLNQLSPTLTLTSSGASSVNGLVTFTASVGGVTITPIGPTGTVSFTAGTTAITCVNGTTGVVNSAIGVATCATYSLTAGQNQTITATYPGDLNYAKASGTTSQNVNAANTTVSVSSSLSGGSSVNQPVAFTATIGYPSGPLVPTGTVVYSDGATTLCTFPATGSSAFTGGVVPPCTVPLSSQGTHIIKAAFNPSDSNFSGSNGTFSQVVNTTTTTTFAVSSPNPSAVNQSVTFTATVTPQYPTTAFAGQATPTGTVAFTFANPVPPTAPSLAACSAVAVSTTSGVTTAVCSPPITFTATGTYNLVATYTPTPGNLNFSGSASAATGDAQSVVTSTTNVTLSSSLPSPAGSTVNQLVTFIATIAPGNSGTTLPTGTVAFTYAYLPGAAATLGTCSSQTVSTVAPVTATCTAPLPLFGSATIKAVYSGDTNFVPGSQTLVQPVGQTATSTSVAASPSSLSVNQPVTFIATVASAIAGATTPTGSVAFSYTPSGGTAVPIAACSAQPVSTVSGTTTAQCTGQALPTAASTAAPYTLMAVYTSGDKNFATSSGTAPLSVGKTTTTATLVSAPNPSAVNQQVTFTATVIPAYSGATKPIGTVSFANTTNGSPGIPLQCSQGNANAPVATSAGVTTAVCSYTFSSNASYSIAATYNGDSNFSPSSSAVDVQNVGAGATSIAVVSSLPTGSFVNQQVAFGATISFVSSGSTMPTGTVTYYDGAAALPNCAFTATTASPFTGGSVPACQAALSSQGSHTIAAKYSGDTNFSGSNGAFVQTVNTATTTTNVASSPNPSNVNQAVGFTATVTPAYTAGTANPTGTVSFTYAAPIPANAPSLASCSSVSVTTAANVTTAVCSPITFDADGIYTVVSTYTPTPGNLNFSGGAGPISQVVGLAPTTTTVTSLSTNNTSTVNQQVTFKAAIKYTIAGATSPTGTVTYYDGATPLPNCTFTSTGSSVFKGGNVPSCMATLYTTGIHPITALYSGDSNFITSTSTILSQNVTADVTTTVFTASPTSTPINIPVTFTVQVTPAGAGSSSQTPTGTVAFTYNGNGVTGGQLPGCTTAAVKSGVNGTATASCTVNLPNSAVYTIIATYSGDINFKGSTVSSANFTVGATPTTLSLSSTLPTSVVSQIVTFTAQVVSGNPGAVAPSGTVSFTSTDPSSIASQCSAQPVTPVENAKATGFDGIATCSVQFPITEQFTAPFAVSAVYNPATTPVQDFTTSNNSIQQAVQNYSVAFSAPVSGTPPALAPVFVTQGYSNTSDPFNPKTSITVQVTSSGLFSDSLNITCTVTAKVVFSLPGGQAVSDPSCAATSSASTLSGVTGSTLSFTVTASAAAPVGSYNVTITATDNSANQTKTNGGAAYSLSETTTTNPVVYVVGQSAPLTLAQGATGNVIPTFNTSTAPSSDNLTTFACGSIEELVNGSPSGNPFSSAGVLTCSGPSGVTVGSNGLTAVPIQVTLITTSAQLNRSSTVSLAALLGIPLLALMGWFGNRKSPRRNFFRFIGLILMMVGVTYAVTGCGGSFKQTGSQPSNSGLGVGTYLVQVVATDQAGNKYFAVVPLTVNSNNVTQ